jgi:hypothetical protein
MQHSGIEFEVTQVGPRRWLWTIYPKKSLRATKVTREFVANDRREAIAQCKLEIDRKLWRQMNA